MGEAKRRKARRAIPKDVRADIAKAVRTINVSLEGGTCFFRQTVAAAAFYYLGISYERRFGSMLYRAGPDPDWDVVAFCSYYNAGAITPTGFLGHAWIESDEDLIDFTVGDWQWQIKGAIAVGAAAGEDRNDRPINWTAPPLPAFFWGSVHDFVNPWRQEGQPDLGTAWYGPLGLPKGEEMGVAGKRLRQYVNHATDILSPTFPYLHANLDALHVRERLLEGFSSS